MQGVKHHVSIVAGRCVQGVKHHVSILAGCCLQGHEGSCKFQPTTCEKCGELVTKQKLETHKSRECPQLVIKCEHCEAQMAQVKKKVSDCMDLFLFSSFL